MLYMNLSEIHLFMLKWIVRHIEEFVNKGPY